MFSAALAKDERSSPLYRTMRRDTKKGEIIEEKKFHYRRKINGNLELFVDKEKKEYEVIDIIKGEVVLKGKYDQNDIPDKKDRYWIIDLDRFPAGVRFMGGFKSYWEFSPLLTENGLIISSRRYVNKFKTGVSESIWVLLDPKNNSKKKITPAPMSGIDMAVKNIGNKMWPVIIPNIRYSGRIGGIDKFWVIRKDGTITAAPLPVIEGIKKFRYHFFWNLNWVHDGEYIYYLHFPLKLFSKKGGGELYRFKIGETASKLIFTYKDRERYGSISHGEGRFVILPGKEIKLLKLPEGNIIPHSEFSNKIGTELWKKVKDMEYARKKIPLGGLPATFKKYSKYNFKMNSSTKNFIFYLF